ncbi:hypothetical protein 7t3_0244 [Salmonella phage 7t3]|nr:hypothetical protein 7t3_0244 [Salmonella phage 7t3]
MTLVVIILSCHEFHIVERKRVALFLPIAVLCNGRSLSTLNTITT